LAQASNSGGHTLDQFAVIPEFGATVGWDITSRLRANVGYTFIYWTGLARPGEQIDTKVNLSQLSPGGLVGAAVPKFPGLTSDFWAQGLAFGLAYRF
jgi:hypothetical protein